MLYRIIILTAFCFVFFESKAQSKIENTIKFKEGNTSPKASINDVYWIEGYWYGEAFGGLTQEIWSAPLGKSMMGSFKLVVNNEVNFYELETISEENETLILRIKHFDKNLNGWEEKNESIEFKLVDISPNKVFFDGLTFEKVSENEMNVYVIVNHKGIESEELFNYKRKR